MNFELHQNKEQFLCVLFIATVFVCCNCSFLITSSFDASGRMSFPIMTFPVSVYLSYSVTYESSISQMPAVTDIA